MTRRGDSMMRLRPWSPASLASLALVLGACGFDPCADRAGTCLAVHVRGGPSPLTKLHFDLRGAAATSFDAERGEEISLPAWQGIGLPEGVTGSISLAAIGYQDGLAVSSGGVEVEVSPGMHRRIDLVLQACVDCSDGGADVDGQTPLGDGGAPVDAECCPAAGKKTLGEQCSGDGSECESDNCVDGYCCDMPLGECSGCKACNLEEHRGECMNVPGGQDPHDVCSYSYEGCTLDACNGEGSCLAAAGTECAPSGCAVPSSLTTHECSATGSCDEATDDCPHHLVCTSATSCGTSCSTNDHCVAGYFCAVDEATPGDGECRPLLFEAAVSYTAGTSPIFIDSADMNHDGTPELVVANNGSGGVPPNSGSITVLFNDSTNRGVFSGPQVIAEGVNRPTSLVLGNFRNPNTDMAITNAALLQEGIVVYLYMSSTATSVSFGAPTQYGVSGGPHLAHVRAGDVNEDAKVDLITVGASTNRVYVFDGGGDGVFSAGTNVSASGTSGTCSVVLADLYGAAHLDLAATNELSTNLTTWRNNDGLLDNDQLTAVGASPVHAVAGLINGDAHVDLVVANQSSNNVSVLLGNGNGTFAPAVNYAVAAAPSSVALQDFDGDARLDIAAAGRDANVVTVLLGRGDGTFWGRHDYGVGDGPVSVVAAHLKNDAKWDLATANSLGGVSVLLAR